MQANPSVSISYYDYQTKKNEEPSSELDKDDFLELLITELKYQDPLEPMDTSKMMEQTTQLSTMEYLENISNSMDEILEGNSLVNTEQMMLSASNYIGKTVEFEGNSIILAESQAPITYDLEDTPANVEIYIYNSAGQIVQTLKPETLKSGVTSIMWNGKDMEGNQLVDGYYSFLVKATDGEGEDIEMKTYAVGVVTAVSRDGDKVSLNINGTTVDSTKITTVTN